MVSIGLQMTGPVRVFLGLGFRGVMARFQSSFGSELSVVLCGGLGRGYLQGNSIVRLSAGPAGLRVLQEGRTVHVLDFLSLHTVLIGACGLRGVQSRLSIRITPSGA